jgi:hypothetical protein
MDVGSLFRYIRERLVDGEIRDVGYVSVSYIL